MFPESDRQKSDVLLPDLEVTKKALVAGSVFFFCDPHI